MMQSIVRWYVAKIKPRTEKKIKKYLDSAGLEIFQSLHIPNTIFVRSDKKIVLSLPKDCGLMMDFQYDPATHQLQTISDKQMADFIFLQNHSGDLIVLPEPEKLIGGEKVKVIGGEFAGIEGEIYRIKGHKRVVVRLGNLGAVALGSYVAKENLEKICKQITNV
jgi:transcription antitermination factor NusG